MSDDSIIEAIGKLIEPRRQDQEFMRRLRARIEEDRPILDRLRETERIDRIPSHVSPPRQGGPVYVQIDRLPYKVKVGTYTGAQIRRFAAPPIADDRDLWMQEPFGENDLLIRDDDTVALGPTTGTRLWTHPRFINGG